MLEYGTAYLEQNEVAIAELEQGMSRRAVELAKQMAEEELEEERAEFA